MAAKKSPAGKSLDEFAAAHDPAFERLAPTTVYARELPKGIKRYIITAAQNATPVHPEFWAVIQTMIKHFNAELMVIPIRYKNPTSTWSGSQSNEEYWFGEVRPYLWNVRHKLNKNLTLLADMKIQPTASSPLTGADGLSHASSGIIGHTKVQLKTIPTPQSRMAKILMTTGACTVENYTDSRAGKLGAFHHSLSCVLVEVDGGWFSARHVHYDPKSKSATDLDARFTTAGMHKAPRPAALNMGDTHVDFIDPAVERATFDAPESLINALRPENLIWHDLNDDYACNPHHEGNPFNPIAKLRGGRDSVRGEVFRAIHYVIDRTPEDCKSYIVPSNHNDFLGRWINRHDWRTDPLNAEFYLETAWEMVKDTRMTPKGTHYPDPFTFWLRRVLRERGIKNIVALDADDSLMLAGIENGLHGHQGPNGARGSINNLRRLGVRVIIGHSHSPGIDEGAYQNGTSTRLRLEYNHGASSWQNAHTVLHADSKRQLIFVIDGRYRLTG